MTLQQIIIAILQALLALARTPTEETDSITRQKADLQLRRDELNTFCADSEFNSDEVQEILNDLTEVLATSTPSEDYAEVPDTIVEGEAEPTEEEEPVKEEPIEEEDTATPPEEEVKEEVKETPHQKRLREKAEAEAEAKAKAKSKHK